MTALTLFMRIFGCLSFGLLALGTTNDSHAEEPCGFYPENVHDVDGYLGWSPCLLKDQGERPIWKHFPKKQKRISRFVFLEGHNAFFRFVVVRETLDGTGEIKTGGANNPGWRPIRLRRSPLSAQQISELNALAARSGTWDHDVGSWDGDEVFVDCEILEMEMATASEYKFSSVNIGCNRPEALMPFIDEVVRLAGMQLTDDGRYR